MRNSRESSLKKEIVKEIDNMEDKEKLKGGNLKTSHFVWGLFDTSPEDFDDF